jgi:signal transduction histidine kinase
MAAHPSVPANRRRASTRRGIREKALLRQLELLQSTLEHIGEGCSVFDRQGRLVARNSRFLELLDLPADVKPGTSLRHILTYQAKRGDFGSIDPKQTVIQRSGDFYRDLPKVIERQSDSGRILQIRRCEMPDGNIISIYSDVTETRKSEESAVRARQQAELASRAKGDFLANMSHELRTPLNAIIGFSEMICEEVLGPLRDEQYLEYIHDIHATGLHLLSIINDVLDMSKIEAGKLELASEPVVMQQIVVTAVRMLSEQAKSARIEVITRLPVDNLVVLGDERALRQITLNLLSNAIKFSHAGSRIEIRAMRDPEDDLLLEFDDNGIGMTVAELERAMQPFGQCNPVSTRKEQGTGLGLPITKGLVEAHGGTLAVESAVGIGTLVRICLPALPSPGADDVRDDVKPRLFQGDLLSAVADL